VRGESGSGDSGIARRAAFVAGDRGSTRPQPTGIQALCLAGRRAAIQDFSVGPTIGRTSGNNFWMC
jgi:hypothetical protein